MATPEDMDKQAGRHHRPAAHRGYPSRHPGYRFCPPGQAKKGRC
jgi:hypothetical protein